MFQGLTASPSPLQAVARRLCINDPVHLFVGAVSDKLVANRDITQLVQVSALLSV